MSKGAAAISIIMALVLGFVVGNITGSRTPSEPGGVKNGNGVSSGRLVPSMAPLGHGLLLSEVLVLGLRASVSNASPSACMDVGSGRAALGSSADCISLGVLEG